MVVGATTVGATTVDVVTLGPPPGRQ
jgi:hypothetical protein